MLISNTIDKQIVTLQQKAKTHERPGFFTSSTNCIHQLYNEIHCLIHESKIQYINYQSEKETHKNQSKYMGSVLQNLPFLYCKSKEMENYQWQKLAYDLATTNELIPELVRYQVGPQYFISFGNISNQLKREFFKLFAINDRKCTGYRYDNDEYYGNKPIVYRTKAASEDFEYFTFQEIKQLIICGERIVADFNQTTIPQDRSQQEWYHRWGYVYETNSDSIRAIELEIGNCNLELSFLEDLLLLKLCYYRIESVNTSISELIEQKVGLIQHSILPKLMALRDEKLQKLHKVKRFSKEYYDILQY